MRRNNQSGQAVLVVLLSLSVVLIVVLFILSRSITDISLSTKEEDSLRAFSAAEAGIERALLAGSGSGSIGSANYSTTVTGFASGLGYVTYPIAIKSGENATFWFKRDDESISFSGGQVKFCWGNVGTSSTSAETPALEITFFYTTVPNNLTTLRLARFALDPNSSRRSSNGFEDAQIGNCTIGEDTYVFQKTLNVPNNIRFATAKILYNIQTAHKVGISVGESGSILPSQGEKIESAGSYGDANRRIDVYQLHSEAPPIFANVLFSTNGIIKN